MSTIGIFMEGGTYDAGFFDSDYSFRQIKVTPERTVRCFEIEFFSEDGGTTYMDGIAYPIRAGHILVARPGQVRHSELPLRASYLKIEESAPGFPEIVEEFLPFFASSHIDTYPERIRSLLSAKDAHDDLRAHALCLSLLSDVREESEREKKLGALPLERNRSAVSSALAYIDKHFSERCTLEDIAEAAHFSPVYFHTVFEAAIGKTPYAAVTERRMEEAKRRLSSPKENVGGIALACGFSSQSYFNYVFKKEVGQTPTSYRKEILTRYFSSDGKKRNSGQ